MLLSLLIYQSGHGMFYSSNSGATWTLSSPNIPSYSPVLGVASSSNGQIVLAAVNGKKLSYKFYISRVILTLSSLKYLYICIYCVLILVVWRRENLSIYNHYL